MRDAELSAGFTGGDGAAAPYFAHCLIFRRAALWAAAELYAAFFRGFDALGLPLADVRSLVFRDEGQHLQHDVAEKRADEILSAPRVQQRHVDRN